MAITFKGTTKKIPLSKIDLKEFLEFYKKEICTYKFKYLLENNTEIIVDFKERNFCHIIGLHKFERIRKYKNSENINTDILNENKKICVPVSLLVDRNDRFSKMNLKELKIKEINILKK